MTDTSLLQRNILLYRIYKLFCEPLFWGPIVIRSLQKLGHMTLPEIYFMESVVLGLFVLLDIPTGALADCLGRKKTVFLGQVFLTVSFLFFATMQSPVGAWIGNTLWAIGFSLQSGATSALFFETLKELGREHEHKKLESKYTGWRLLLIALCSPCTGLLADVNLRIPLLASIPLLLVPLVALYLMTEPIHVGKASVRKHVAIIKDSIHFSRSSTSICWIMGFSTIIGVSSKLWFFTYNPYFEKVGVDLKLYGFIFFLINIVAWLSSHFMYKIEEHIGEQGCIALMIGCIGIPMIMMGLFPIYACAYLVLFQNVVRGFLDIFIKDFANHHIQESRIRSTVLSVRSTVHQIVSIISLALFGKMIASVGLLSSLTIVGIAVLVLGAYLLKRYTKLF